MRQAARLLRPAANQTKSPVWQDPVYGYYETHGASMEFKAGEDYGISELEKKRVLHRNRVKEILKKEYLRREYDPFHYQYKQGAVMDPAMYRWYAADRTAAEHFRATPRTMFVLFGIGMGGLLLTYRLTLQPREDSMIECRDGIRPWWDRQQGRDIFTGGNAAHAPSTNK